MPVGNIRDYQRNYATVCSLFLPTATYSQHLEPDVVNFLLSLKGPIPMQTYEPVDGHSWRVSHVVSHLLMGLTGHRLKECPSSKDYGAFTYMYGCK